MSKRLIVLVVFICLASVSVILFLMKQSADRARKVSNEYLDQFRTIDKELKQGSSRLDSLNKMVFDSLRNAGK